MALTKIYVCWNFKRSGIKSSSKTPGIHSVPSPTVSKRRVPQNNLSESERQRLVVDNQALAGMAAKRFKTYEDYEDLRQVGLMGLMHAAKIFNPSKSKFSAYAMWWIRAKIFKFQRANRSMVRPRSDVYKFVAADLPLDQPVSEEEGSLSFKDLLADPNPSTEESLVRESRTNQVRQVLACLSLDPSNKDILEFRLKDNLLTLEEIGQKHGLSRERVRQKQAKLVRRLKRLLKDVHAESE